MSVPIIHPLIADFLHRQKNTGTRTYLINGIHPPISVIPVSLGVRARHRARDVLGRDAHEILPRLAANEHVVLLERDEDVDVECGQVDLVDIEGRDVLSERCALRRREGVRVSVDSPQAWLLYKLAFGIAELGCGIGIGRSWGGGGGGCCFGRLISCDDCDGYSRYTCGVVDVYLFPLSWFDQ